MKHLTDMDNYTLTPEETNRGLIASRVIRARDNIQRIEDARRQNLNGEYNLMESAKEDYSNLTGKDAKIEILELELKLYEAKMDLSIKQDAYKLGSNDDKKRIAFDIMELKEQIDELLKSLNQ